MPGRCMLRKLTGCRLVVARDHPHRPLEWSGSYPNADRHCCIDLVFGARAAPCRRSPRRWHPHPSKPPRRKKPRRSLMPRPPDSNAATGRFRFRNMAASSAWRTPGSRQDRQPTGPLPIPRRLRTSRRRTRRDEPRLWVEEADPFLNQGCTAEVGRLPKRVMLYIDPGPWGHVAEWLRNGLQNRVHQFNSGRGLHLNH